VCSHRSFVLTGEVKLSLNDQKDRYFSSGCSGISVSGSSIWPLLRFFKASSLSLRFSASTDRDILRAAEYLST
jgi:hypothetical protein